MEKEKKVNDEMVGIEVSETEKENLVVREDLDIVVESIGFVSKKTNYGTNSRIKLTLKDGTSTEIKCDNDFLILVKTLTKYEGKAINSKKLVEDIYTKDDKVFLSMSINVELVDGQTYKFFVPRSFQTVINIYYRYLKNKK